MVKKPLLVQKITQKTKYLQNVIYKMTLTLSTDFCNESRVVKCVVWVWVLMSALVQAACNVIRGYTRRRRWAAARFRHWVIFSLIDRGAVSRRPRSTTHPLHCKHFATRHLRRTGGRRSLSHWVLIRQHSDVGMWSPRRPGRLWRRAGPRRCRSAPPFPRGRYI